MAIVGKYTYRKEDSFRLDVVNALEAHDHQLTAWSLADTLGEDEVRTATLKATRIGEDRNYASIDPLRDAVAEALASHGYALKTFKTGGVTAPREVAVTAVRGLVNEQLTLASATLRSGVGVLTGDRSSA